MRRWIWLVPLLGVLILQLREPIADWIDPPQPIAVPAGFEVELYATATCPYCARTRKLLNALHVPYREIDVEQSDENMAEFERLGGTGVPLLVIGDERVHGYDPEAIEAALRKLTRPTTTVL